VRAEREPELDVNVNVNLQFLVPGSTFLVRVQVQVHGSGFTVLGSAFGELPISAAAPRN